MMIKDAWLVANNSQEVGHVQRPRNVKCVSLRGRKMGCPSHCTTWCVTPEDTSRRGDMQECGGMRA